MLRRLEGLTKIGQFKDFHGRTVDVFKEFTGKKQRYVSKCRGYEPIPFTILLSEMELPEFIEHYNQNILGEL